MVMTLGAYLVAHPECARHAQSALVNGAVGVVVAPLGRLLLVMGVTVKGGKIAEIDVIADPERLRQFDLAAF
ncbi:MAG TPA: hypothetical protein VGK74_15510 [Symbiobacteriaceae bacterium]|jgi:RNA polymerase sigma-70 factor (ECF subfamily)